jgi:predicted ArsR family transcriptional regulator
MTIMKPTTRQHILEYFRKNQSTSAKELSLLMGLTGANIRHHLAVLEDYGLIEVIGHRQEGRGRPNQIFGLSRQVLGDGLDKLAGAILDVWLDELVTKVELDKRILLVAEKLAGNVEPNTPVMKRLGQTIEKLNELRYQARWEASAAGPRLILGHCPYAAIIDDHPELCRMDEILLAGRLGSSIEQIAKLQMSEKGLPFCAFLMEAN